MRRGAAKAAVESLALGPVMVAAHFPVSLDEARAALAGADADVELVRGTVDGAGARALLERVGSQRVLLVLSEQLRVRPPEVEVAPAEGSARPRLTMIGWERYPLRSRDEVVTRFAEELNVWYACELGFHAALDRLPLSMFAGESTRNILQRLGMGPMDSIEHPMLSKSLQRAQEKVAEKTPEDPRPKARSATEWLEAFERTSRLGV